MATNRDGYRYAQQLQQEGAEKAKKYKAMKPADRAQVALDEHKARCFAAGRPPFMTKEQAAASTKD